MSGYHDEPQPTLDLQAPDQGSAVDTLPLPTTLNGRFRVTRLLGQGGMAVVYSATDLTSGRELALKMLRARRHVATSLALFKSEFATLAKLAHPNIAAVYDLEQRQDTADHFFTMELLEGQDAFTATADAPLEQVLRLALQVLDALEYLHALGVVHLDLKPSNLMVLPDNRVRLLDFGVARSARSGAPQPFATPSYVAPELLETSSSIDGRADLYSFGITLFQLIFRRLPRARTARELPLDADERARFPAWLLELLTSLLEPDPTRRCPDARHAISAIREGLGADSQPQPSGGDWQARAAEACFERGALQRGLELVEQAEARGAGAMALGRLRSLAAEAARVSGDPRAATLAALALSALPAGSDDWLRASRVAIAEFNPLARLR